MVESDGSQTPAGTSPAQPTAYAQDLSRSLGLRENMFITLSSVTPASSVFIIMPSAISGPSPAPRPWPSRSRPSPGC